MEKDVVEKEYKFGVRDFIVTAIIFVLGGLLFILMRSKGQDGTEVVVSVDGRVVAAYSLDTDGEYELNSGSNILLIQNGKASITTASCPDKLCVKMKSISQLGQSIICLPNKLVVTVKDNKINNSKEYDFVL